MNIIEKLQAEKAESLKVLEVKHQGVSETLEELKLAIEAVNSKLIKVAQGGNLVEPLKGSNLAKWVDPQDDFYTGKC